MATEIISHNEIDQKYLESKKNPLIPSMMHLHSSNIPKIILFHFKFDEICLIIYYFTKQKHYQAEFTKNGTKFIPTDSKFEAFTIEMLMQYIEMEMRNLEFSMFLGVISKKKIFQELSSKALNYFKDFP